jgi:hypothetical protein
MMYILFSKCIRCKVELYSGEIICMKCKEEQINFKDDNNSDPDQLETDF